MKKGCKEKIIKRLYGVLFTSIIVLLILMLAGIVIFFIHYPGNIGELWNSDAGQFVSGIFSAIFTGLNVFAFVLLTHSINSQNAKRQQDLAYYDGLKYKLERQNELLSKFDEMIPRYLNANYFKQLKSLDDIHLSLILMKQDKITLYTIYGSNNNGTRIFCNVYRDDIDELQDFIVALDKLLDKYDANTFERHSYLDTIDEFFKKSEYIQEDIIAIKEGIQEDIRWGTFETLQIISKGESNISREPEEKSQRYLNIKRRKSSKLQ